jgi:hypothetical protein
MANGFTGDEVWNGDGLEIFVGADNPDQGGALKVKDRNWCRLALVPANPFIIGSRACSNSHLFNWL